MSKDISFSAMITDKLERVAKDRGLTVQKLVHLMLNKETVKAGKDVNLVVSFGTEQGKGSK